MVGTAATRPSLEAEPDPSTLVGPPTAVALAGAGALSSGSPSTRSIRALSSRRFAACVDGAAIGGFATPRDRPAHVALLVCNKLNWAIGFTYSG